MAGHVFGAYQIHTIAGTRNETDFGGGVHGCEFIRLNGSIAVLDRHIVDLDWAVVSIVPSRIISKLNEVTPG
jgi:hypothetical protein